MQVTTEQLVAEAGAMALELRFKEQAIARLEQENAQLRAQLAEHEAPAAGDGVAAPEPDS